MRRGWADLEVFHEHSDDDVDEHELSHQHKNDEKDGRNDTIHATVAHAVGRIVAVVAKCILPSPKLVHTNAHRSYTLYSSVICY